ncbi:RNA recognition motif domain-containing protein [Kaarinaea lacus]
MTIKFPSFKQYSSGLVATLLVFALLYFLMEGLQIISIATLPAVLAGLLIGQFIGAMFTGTAGAAIQQESGSGVTQTIYIGNLPFKTTRSELSELFLPFGRVHSARIMIDKATRKPRGYGFVEMDRKNALKAINKLNGSSFIGRNIKVSEANERN